MSREQSTVSDIFRRAQAIMRENPDGSLRDVRRKLHDELKGSPMPPLHNLTIPEQDDRAPEEDWTAGLSVVRRGIQNENWQEIVTGIMLSLEQTIHFERDHGAPGSADRWHDRTVGIRSATEKGVGKWMPEDLMRLAERATKK
ncbi:MAG TPA: hypothetical protein VEY09_12110 [Pyrinomonadaceae bacterium]|nr:hypothetical protein [Pyrinomonadaceae bacterium]